MSPRDEAPPEGPACGFESRTAARLARTRAACELPVARTFGTLEGRVGEAVHAVAIESGGRFGAVAYRGGVQRWDLGALECVDAWPVPYAGRGTCRDHAWGTAADEFMRHRVRSVGPASSSPA